MSKTGSWSKQGGILFSTKRILVTNSFTIKYSARPLGNNPQFLKVLRDIGKEPLAINVADISRFSSEQRRDMAGAVAMDLLRHTGVPVNANHPIIQQLAQVLDEK